MAKIKKYLQTEDGKDQFIDLIEVIFRVLFELLVTMILLLEGHWKLGILMTIWVINDIFTLWCLLCEFDENVNELGE